VAQDIHSKAELLKDTLFPPPPAADLSNIPGYEYPELIKVPAELSIDEVKRAILRSKKDSAPGPNKIPNRVIHLIARHSLAPIMKLFQACLNQEVHPDAFKKVMTVILRKEGNRDYLSPKIYKLITLLNTLGKALELVISNYLCFLVETYALLLKT